MTIAAGTPKTIVVPPISSRSNSQAMDGAYRGQEDPGSPPARARFPCDRRPLEHHARSQSRWRICSIVAALNISAASAASG